MGLMFRERFGSLSWEGAKEMFGIALPDLYGSMEYLNQNLKQAAHEYGLSPDEMIAVMAFGVLGDKNRDFGKAPIDTSGLRFPLTETSVAKLYPGARPRGVAGPLGRLAFDLPLLGCEPPGRAGGRRPGRVTGLGLLARNRPPQGARRGKRRVLVPSRRPTPHLQTACRGRAVVSGRYPRPRGALDPEKRLGPVRFH